MYVILSVFILFILKAFSQNKNVLNLLSALGNVPSMFLNFS